ncbi:site-specific integrase [Coleofasciculus sp. LEGE 07081]|uniref:tyrosine-type recombinase/integrase n=1 Tax=Coleofasciculus sp. LEGE 07081 TaxID=2777967 RepID=UPI00187F07BD|nr:site-specific integrase [Coleofasciculus sp. LEGE 07081]MBE9129099.1 site-specific integrase [Coleofasciculus sp. LEGE 07081]
MGRVFLGYENGKQKRHTIYGKTEAEVHRAAQEFRVKIEAGAFAPTTRDCKVAEYLEQWLEIYVTSPPLAPKTVKSYSEQTRNHLIPSLGSIPLRKLSPKHVQSMMKDKLASGLSATSVNGVHRVLRAALSQAVKDRQTVENVAKLTKPPKVTTRAEMHFTQPELQKLFAAAQGHHLQYLFCLAPYIGLRLGEITGLRWENIDFPNQTLRVRNQLQWVDGKPTLREPKSANSKRVLPIGELVEMLQSQRSMNLVNGWENKMNLVFVSSTGNPLDPKLVNKHLKILCKKAQIREMSFHSFRHTTATLLLGAGEEAAEVMNMLGHSQISLTVNTYGGVLREAQKRAASKIRKAIDHGI